MGDEVYVTLRQAAALLNQPLRLVQGWAEQSLLGRVRWSKRRRLVRLGAVRARAEVAAARFGGRRPEGRSRGREPTAAELEALIAEQLACAPEWFWSDHAARNGRAAAAAYRERARAGRAAA